MRLLALIGLYCCVSLGCGAPPEGVTYFAIDSSPISYVSGGGVGLKLSPASGSKFGTSINQNGTIVLGIAPPSGDDWSVFLRAPNRKPFEVKTYPDAVRADVSPEYQPWIWLCSGSRGPNDTTGWFRINEVEMAPNNSRINRLSCDFLVIEHDGSRSFGRYRLRATVDPVPTAAEIQAALAGAPQSHNEVIQKMEGSGLETAAP